MGQFTFASSGAILDKAGAQVSSDVSNAMLLRYSDQAESLINGIARVDLVAAYATLPSDLKIVLEDMASSYAGMLAIQYDPSKFTSRTFAETKLDILRDNFERGANLIKEDKWKKFVGAN